MGLFSLTGCQSKKPADGGELTAVAVSMATMDRTVNYTFSLVCQNGQYLLTASYWQNDDEISFENQPATAEQWNELDKIITDNEIADYVSRHPVSSNSSGAADKPVYRLALTYSDGTVLTTGSAGDSQSVLYDYFIKLAGQVYPVSE